MKVSVISPFSVSFGECGLWPIKCFLTSYVQNRLCNLKLTLNFLRKEIVS
jgi:hypothetical protein